MDWKTQIVSWAITGVSAISGLVVMRVLGFGYAVILELLNKPENYDTPFVVVDIIVVAAIIASITTHNILTASRLPAIFLRLLGGNREARSL